MELIRRLRLLFSRPRAVPVTLEWLSHEAFHQLTYSPLGASYRGVLIHVYDEDSWARVIGGSDYPIEMPLLEASIYRNELVMVEHSVELAVMLASALLFRGLSSALAQNEKTA